MVEAALKALDLAARRCASAHRRSVLDEHARELRDAFGRGPAAASERDTARVERAYATLMRRLGSDV